MRTLRRSVHGLLQIAAVLAAAGLPLCAQADPTLLNAFGNGFLTAPQDSIVVSSTTLFVADTGDDLAKVFDANDNPPGSDGQVIPTNPSGLSVSAVGFNPSNGCVYILQNGTQNGTQYSGIDTVIENAGPGDGDNEGSFGSFGSAPGQLWNPQGIAFKQLGNDNFLTYVADTGNSRIEVFDENNKFVETLPELVPNPQGIAFGTNGDIYVSASNYNQIYVLDPNGNLLSTFGSGGSGPGDISYAEGIACSSTGLVYVADWGNNRIDVFDAAGNPLYTFGGDGTLQKPDGVTVAPTGMVYVSDTGHNQMVRYFDPNSWTAGTNTFTDSTIGPTSITLSSNITMNASMGLVVGNTTTISNSTLTLSGGSISTGTLAISNGTFVYNSGSLTTNQLILSNNATASVPTLTLSQTSTIDSSSTLNVAANSNLTVTNFPLINDGAINLASGAILNLDNGFDSNYINSNGMPSAGTISSANATINVGPLAFNAIFGPITGPTQLNIGTDADNSYPDVLKPSVQLLSGSGTYFFSAFTNYGSLDMTNNFLIVEDSTSSHSATFTSLQGQVAGGHIFSSTANPDVAPSKMRLVAVDNAVAGLSSFGGKIVDAGSILVGEFYLGDATLDGQVDLNDLNIVLNNLGTSDTSWAQGNFDGAATIDLNDLNDVLNNLGEGVAQPPAIVQTRTATPEPASCVLLALAAPLLLRKRTRQRV